MSIAHFPADLQCVTPMTCSICRARLYLSTATVGLYDAENRQAFACISHFSEVELLIGGWADFIARERIRYRQQNQRSNTLMDEEGRNAWLNS